MSANPATAAAYDANRNPVIGPDDMGVTRSGQGQGRAADRSRLQELSAGT